MYQLENKLSMYLLNINRPPSFWGMRAGMDERWDRENRTKNVMEKLFGYLITK
jgi:hypothetical protein